MKHNLGGLGRTTGYKTAYETRQQQQQRMGSGIGAKKCRHAVQ